VAGLLAEQGVAALSVPRSLRYDEAWLELGAYLELIGAAPSSSSSNGSICVAPDSDEVHAAAALFERLQLEMLLAASPAV
jgi:hypothetical protein